MKTPETTDPDRRDYKMPDGRLSAVHYNAALGPLALVFIIANGFNALAYRELLQPLKVHSAALDMRGHGLSDLPADPKGLRNWNIFRNDIAYFLQHHCDRPVIVAGHSFGATSAIMASQLAGGRYAAFVGFDPVIMPLAVRALPYLPGGRELLAATIPEAKKAGRRKSEFASKDEAYQRYKNRGAFKNISDAALKDYIDGGLIATDNGFKLACAPQWERAIYTAQGNNALASARYLPPRTKIIFAGVNPITPPHVRRRLSRILGGSKVTLRDELEHLFPLTEPKAARAYLDEAIKAASA